MNAKQIKILLKEYASKNDRTNIFKLFVKKTGLKIRSLNYHYEQIADFIIKYCGKRFYSNNYNLVVSPRYIEVCSYIHIENKTERRIKIIKALKDELKEPFNNYTKLPYYGNTNLYFLSPQYGHRDYNKLCAIPIKGNEKFCERLINIAKSKYPQFYGK